MLQKNLFNLFSLFIYSLLPVVISKCHQQTAFLNSQQVQCAVITSSSHDQFCVTKNNNSEVFLHPDLSKISMRTEASNLHPGDLRHLNSYFFGFKFRHKTKNQLDEKKILASIHINTFIFTTFQKRRCIFLATRGRCRFSMNLFTLL